MSQIINNNAIIKYNENQEVKTCDVSTIVEPVLQAYKRAITNVDGVIDPEKTTSGIVGSDRRIIYEIVLSNYSSIDFSNIVVTDKVELPSPNQNDFTLEESELNNEETLPNLKFTIESLPKESTKIIRYTIKLNDNVPVGTQVKNIASIDYDQNPIDESIKPDVITVTIDYSETTIKATKEAPSAVLLGETFSYDLAFANTGDRVAKVNTIEDKLPDNFIIDSVVIKIGESDKKENIDYTLNSESIPLKITAIEEKLNIPAGQTLTVKITGKMS